MGLIHSEVRGHPVPGAQSHEVADHQRSGVYLERGAVADHDDTTGQEISQLLGGPFGPVLLREREDRIEEDDEHDGDAKLGETGDEGECRCDPEHDREEMEHLPDELAPGGGPARNGQDVRTISIQPLRGLPGAQALRSFEDPPVRCRSGLGRLLGTHVCVTPALSPLPASRPS